MFLYTFIFPILFYIYIHTHTHSMDCVCWEHATIMQDKEKQHCMELV